MKIRSLCFQKPVLLVLSFTTLLFACKNSDDSEEPATDDDMPIFAEAPAAISIAERAERIDWLTQNTYVPRSIDPFDEDYSDLAFLKDVIGSKRVVMLGEMSHGDGSTFKAKARLIRFLHQEMGFDMIAWESGLYDCHKAWTKIENGTKGMEAARNSINVLWSATSEVYPVFNYWDGDVTPLELIGFDIQFFGNYKSNFTTDLNAFLKNNDAAFAASSGWTDLSRELVTLFSYYDAPTVLGDIDFGLIDNGLTDLITKLQTFTHNDELPLLSQRDFWVQVCESTLGYAEFTQLLAVEKDYKKAGNARDKYMGGNLNWMINKFSDRKIIVWGATTHLSRNLDKVAVYDVETDKFPLLAPEFTTMGNYTHETNNSHIYTIGFSAYGGKLNDWTKGKAVDLIEPLDGSIEDLLGEVGNDFGFVNYRSDLAPWMSQPFVSKPYGNGNELAIWPEVFDGLFYIKNMEPSSYNP